MRPNPGGAGNGVRGSSAGDCEGDELICIDIGVLGEVLSDGTDAIGEKVWLDRGNWTVVAESPPAPPL